MFVLLFLVIFIGVIIVLTMEQDTLISTKSNKRFFVETDSSETLINSCFPEYDPEEYQRQKRERNDKALNGCEFWDGLNIDFQENLQLLNDKKCPYCSCDLPERKGKSYKCPECKGKIYRLKDLVSDFEGLFTQEQKEIREQLKRELSRRKRFWEIYQNAKGFVDFVPTNLKKDNIIILLGLLNEAKKYISNPSKVDKLRMCRFYEGELSFNIEGYEKLGVNSFLAVAYIDLWGFYNYLYDERNDYKNTFDEKDEELFYQIKQAYEATGNKYYYSSFEEYKNKEIEEYNKSRKPFNDCENSKVAPYVIKKIKSFDYDIEILKGLFIGHAKGIAKSIKYKPPLTPEEAWEKFYEEYINLDSESSSE